MSLFIFYTATLPLFQILLHPSACLCSTLPHPAGAIQNRTAWCWLVLDGCGFCFWHGTCCFCQPGSTANCDKSTKQHMDRERVAKVTGKYSLYFVHSLTKLVPNIRYLNIVKKYYVMPNFLFRDHCVNKDIINLTVQRKTTFGALWHYVI